MRRVLETLTWKVNWWKDRGERWGALDDEEAEGVKVYALDQAGVYQSLRNSFLSRWSGAQAIPSGSRDISGEEREEVPDPALDALVDEIEDLDL